MPRRRPPDDSELASATEGLLAAAAKLKMAAPSPADQPEPASLRGFSELYSDWITFKRGLSGAPRNGYSPTTFRREFGVSRPTVGRQRRSVAS